MRLWHPSLMQEVPTKNLSSLHMSICRVRSTPWGKPTARTWYYNLSWQCLVWYHSLVIKELQARGWRVFVKWLDYTYRGRNAEPSLSSYERDSGHQKELEQICPESVEKQRQTLQGMKEML